MLTVHVYRAVVDAHLNAKNKSESRRDFLLETEAVIARYSTTKVVFFPQLNLFVSTMND